MVEAAGKRDKSLDPNHLVELEDLKLIVAVADARAFRRVARMLGVEPSSVSRRIRAIEDRVGVSLFERYRTGARLTGAGELFLHDIRGALAQIEYATKALREAGVGANGAVTVGITAGLASAPLSSLLTLYRAEHPAVRIELIEGTAESHAFGVSSRVIDVAFVAHTAEEDTFDIAPIWSEALFVGVPKSDSRAQISSLPLEAFARDTFIVANYVQGKDVENFLLRELSKAGHGPKVRHHRVGREALMLMVGLGFGTAVTCQSETIISYPGVAFIRLEQQAITLKAIWSAENDNPALRRLLSLARRVARDQPMSADISGTADRSP